jgi:hypothetical protein
MGDTCDLETLDHFHDVGQPILQHYMDIYDIMATGTQVHNTNDMHNSFVSLMESCQELLELQTFKETFKSLDASSWKVAMDEEYVSLFKNGTWELGHCQHGK